MMHMLFSYSNLTKQVRVCYQLLSVVLALQATSVVDPRLEPLTMGKIAGEHLRVGSCVPTCELFRWCQSAYKPCGHGVPNGWRRLAMTPAHRGRFFALLLQSACG